MRFTKLALEGLYLIELEKNEDERGFFARVWDTKIFEQKVLNSKIVQTNISYTKKKGTIRGIHYQNSPYAEAKYIRCTKGRVFQVAIDLRAKSETYGQWTSVELGGDHFKMVYVAEGFAFGIQSLEDDTELFYHVSQFYSPEHEDGIRWDDATFKIRWPIKPTVISKKDQSWKDFALRSA